MQKYNGAEILIKSLLDQGVDTIFGYPGGAVLPIYDEIFKQNRIRHFLVRHEQAAVHAAEGYARSTGKVGVVLVTSGPGATNAVTGLTDALCDSIPIICITGQVPTHLIGSDAFQECDTTGITRPCTKHNYLVKRVDDLAKTIHQAFYVARSGRPGPVLIDIPKDVQFAMGPYNNYSQDKHPIYRPNTKPESMAVKKAIELLKKAKRPIIYGGGGLINAGPRAIDALRKLVKLTDFPTTLTLMGLGALPYNDPHFLGMLGMHGSYQANLAMHDCDVMLCVGARFDDRITGLKDAFSPHSKKIHIDIDQSSFNKNIAVDIKIQADCGEALEEMIAQLEAEKYTFNRAEINDWWKQIDQWRAKDCFAFKQGDSIIKPQFALQRLMHAMKDKDYYITTEVGQHQMWAAQYLGFSKPHHWMTSGGLGTMGYGFPAAMGVQVAHPDALVIDIAGEASILMNIQEMSTCTQYRLPVKIFILNNQYLGMVRQWQELLHGGRYSESYSDSLPDFVTLAKAFGWHGIIINKPDEIDQKIKEMIETKGPVIVDCRVDPTENCYPMIPSGKPHNEMLLGPVSSGQEAISGAGKTLV